MVLVMGVNVSERFKECSRLFGIGDGAGGG